MINTALNHEPIGSVARLLLAAGLVAMGGLAFASQGFALQMHSWLDDAPQLGQWVNGTSICLIACGMLLGWPATATRGAWCATVLMILWILAISLPTTLHQPGNAAGWLGPTEIMVLAAGFLASALNRRAGSFQGNRWLALVRFSLAPCFILFGVAHFVYLDFTAGMIPDFLPLHRALAALTGTMHIAIGLGLLFARTVRLAFAGAAILMTSFVLLVHVPGVLAAPQSQVQWVMLVKATMLSSSAWALAHFWPAWRRQK